MPKFNSEILDDRVKIYLFDDNNEFIYVDIDFVAVNKDTTDFTNWTQNELSVKILPPPDFTTNLAQIKENNQIIFTVRSNVSQVEKG